MVSAALESRCAMAILLLLAVILFLTGMSLLGGLIFIAALKDCDYEEFW